MGFNWTSWSFQVLTNKCAWRETPRLFKKASGYSFWTNFKSLPRGITIYIWWAARRPNARKLGPAPKLVRRSVKNASKKGTVWVSWYKNAYVVWIVSALHAFLRPIYLGDIWSRLSTSCLSQGHRSRSETRAQKAIKACSQIWKVCTAYQYCVVT